MNQVNAIGRCHACGVESVIGYIFEVLGDTYRVCCAECAFKLGKLHGPRLRRCRHCDKLHVCKPKERRP